MAGYGNERPAGYSTGGVAVADHRFGIDGGVGVKSLAEEDLRPVRPHLVELKPDAYGIAILVFRWQMISINKVTLKPNILRHPK